MLLSSRTGVDATFERMFECIGRWMRGSLSGDTAMHLLSPDVTALEAWYRARKKVESYPADAPGRRPPEKDLGTRHGVDRHLADPERR